MDIDEATGSKIQELQILEQNLQNLLMQKQTVQIELNEVQNALNDLKKTEDEVYKVIGGVMLRSNKADLLKELSEKQKILELRIFSVEKQEKILEEKTGKLRKELTETLTKKKS
ncbi:MAG: prefoldin subunit beta [Candidatus Omnitrophica bacterium]|nr:prefoldin subunit beta [Candidatus Omnitrophota bacterium]